MVIAMVINWNSYNRDRSSTPSIQLDQLSILTDREGLWRQTSFFVNCPRQWQNEYESGIGYSKKAANICPPMSSVSEIWETAIASPIQYLSA
jgi:hypothetical protein